MADSPLIRVVKLIKSYGMANELVINRGTANGVKNGDRYLIFAVGDPIVDPDTGVDLGKLEIIRGRGIVVHAQDKISTVRCIEKGTTRKKKTYTPGGLLFGNHVTEEEIPDNIPFDNAQIGDFARPI